MKKVVLKEAPANLDTTLPKFSPLLRRLLANRGILDEVTADTFLNPVYERDIHDPFLLSDMEKAVERIRKAIKAEETIGLWSDYDHDGIPAGVILRDFFDRIGYAKVINYIPDRHHEGFGLNTDGIDELQEKGVTLIITADCGIADHEEIEYAKKKGIEIIITDHHELLSGGAPEAYAVVNPKITSAQYPEPMLCGSAVAWKLVSALTTKLKDEYPTLTFGWEKWLLDMVGIGTIGDLVPLSGENRALAHFGIKVLQKNRRPGLAALFNKLRLQKYTLGSRDVSFSIVPRINAASRMAQPIIAFNLLRAATEDEGREHVATLEKMNNERKGLVAATVKQAEKMIREAGLFNEPIIFVGMPEWRPALLGLAATSLEEKFGKPVFLWGRDGNGILKGSARSDGGHVGDIFEMLKGCFIAYGGHKGAGGFEIEYAMLPQMHERIKKISLPEAIATIPVDMSLSLPSVNDEVFNEILLLEPFGFGNPAPIFLFEDVMIRSARRFGKSKEHLELILEKDFEERKAIAFFAGEDIHASHTVGKKITVTGEIDKDTFSGSNTIRLRIVDFISVS